MSDLPDLPVHLKEAIDKKWSEQKVPPHPAAMERLKVGRLTVVTNLYFHAVDGEGSIALSRPFSRMLKTDEQPFVRRMTVGEDWQAIDKGWTERPSLVVVENREGQFQQTIPTSEERAEAARKILVLRLGEEDHGELLILPNELWYGTPSGISGMRIRCQYEQAKVTISLFPE